LVAFATVLRRLIATQFIRVMEVGKTAPILCGCHDQNNNYAGEYVVKLRERIGIGACGLLLELLGSRLAAHFDILVPEPAAVLIEPEFAAAFAQRDPNLAASLRASIGLSFGSKMLNPVSTWPINRPIPEAMFGDAVKIFAFDAMIQNPDRRPENPNLFTQGDNIYVYDHETSFSFLLALSPSAEPWNLECEPYLANHVFYRRLRAKEIDLADFKERLDELTMGVLAKIRKDIPEDWQHGNLERIEAHLLAVHDNSERFIEQVRRRLA
jgi:HipA-like kinase